MAYANQRVINIRKQPMKKPFYYTNMENLKTAMQLISTVSALKMFLYLSKNENGIVWDLSSKDFQNWTDLSKNTVDNATKELLKIGYLIQPNEDIKRYIFYDNIDEAKAEKERLKSVETTDIKEECCIKEIQENAEVIDYTKIPPGMKAFRF